MVGEGGEHSRKTVKKEAAVIKRTGQETKREKYYNGHPEGADDRMRDGTGEAETPVVDRFC